MVQDAWDRQAATFDNEPDHGLTAPATRSAWRDLLVSVLPAAPARVADLGRGTGTRAFARWVTLLKPAGTAISRR